MARASTELIDVLRRTAARLESEGAVHRWSHFGLCNCGHLAQTVTRRSAREIQDALFVLPGDWGEKAYDACPTSGLPMDHIFEEMFALGLDRDDFGHLERLSDPAVVRRAGRPLSHTRREDAVAYLRAWADELDEALPTPQTALDERDAGDAPLRDAA